MGGGTWKDKDWTTYQSTTRGASRQEIFKQNRIHDLLNPAKALLRESCDSDDNPNSTPLILALDVTGSMGMIAEQMAKEGLGKLIGGIYERKPVVNPHVMIMAIGDTYVDEAPLQVSQFEADIRVAEQLKLVWLEGMGGGNNTEGYDLPWYFAGTRTKIDSFDKRGKKGYLFTIGDESPPRGASKRNLERIFGPGEYRDWTPAEMLEKAQEKYDVFHIVVEEGSYYQEHGKRVFADWKSVIGKRAIPLSNYKHLPQVVLAVLDVAEGKDPEEVIASWTDKSVQNTVRYALQLG